MAGRKRCGGVPQDCFAQLNGSLSVKRVRSGGHFIEDRAEGKQSRCGHRVSLLAPVLGTCSLPCPWDVPVRLRVNSIDTSSEAGQASPAHLLLRADRSWFRASLGQSEVQNFDLSQRRHNDVGWLDVAMDDAPLVGGVQPVGDLNGNVEQLR